MTKKKKPKYIVVWWDTLQDFDLKPTDLLLVYLISKFTENKNRACYASKLTMSQTLNVSQDTIYSSLNKLERKGIIYRVSENLYNRRTTSIYMGKGWKEYLDNLKMWDLNHSDE